MRGKILDAGVAKLRAEAEQIAESTRCANHPEHRAEVVVNEETKGVAFRGGCCDAFKKQLETTLAARFERAAPADDNKSES